MLGVLCMAGFIMVRALVQQVARGLRHAVAVSPMAAETGFGHAEFSSNAAQRPVGCKITVDLLDLEMVANRTSPAHVPFAPPVPLFFQPSI